MIIQTDKIPPEERPLGDMGFSKQMYLPVLKLAEILAIAYFINDNILIHIANIWYKIVVIEGLYLTIDPLSPNYMCYEQKHFSRLKWLTGQISYEIH